MKTNKQAAVMDFRELYEHNQGAVFFKRDVIHALRKNLAEYFFRHGEQYKESQLMSSIEEIREVAKELRKHSRHSFICSNMSMDAECDCGYNDAISKYNSIEQKLKEIKGE